MSSIPTEKLVDYFNERHEDLQRTQGRNNHMLELGADPNGREFITALGRVVGRDEELRALQAFLEMEAADSVGKLSVEHLLNSQDD